MNTQHTPAPWVVSDNAVFGSHGVIKPLVADLDGRFHDDESKANARLIAAAPDLLVALQEVLKTLEGYDVDYPEVAPVFSNAYAAITKATEAA